MHNSFVRWKLEFVSFCLVSICVPEKWWNQIVEQNKSQPEKNEKLSSKYK